MIATAALAVGRCASSLTFAATGTAIASAHAT